MLFDTQFYLQMNPDVAGAVARGEITAEEHFNLFGRFENRAPSPFFDPELYAAANPDVAAAVSAGLIPSLFDHFNNNGQEEGRDASYFFDAQVYLVANPDIAAAVASGAIGSAWEHFLEFGQNEVRNTSQFFDMQAYLRENPDVAAAVQAGQTTAFDHFLNNGFQEGRSIGNGISLAQFANDTEAQIAIRNGDIGALMERVAEVAPFLPTYTPPAGYVIPSNQPIPQNFTPVEGENLVVPPGVVVPPGTELPGSFDPPVSEEPETPPGDTDPGTTEPEPDVLSGEKVDVYTASGALVGGYDNIVDAVALAQAGQRIEVRDIDAAYAGDLLLNVTGLTINGNGAAIEGGTYITGAGTTIAGFYINGTLDDETVEGATVFIQANDVHIKNNFITGRDLDGRTTGVITTGGLSGIEITGNKISGFDGYGIFLNPTEEPAATVTENTLSNNRIGVSYDTNGAEDISGNTFSGSSIANVQAWFREGGGKVDDVVGDNEHGALLEGAVQVRVALSNGQEVTGTAGDDIIQEFDLGDEVTMSGDDVIIPGGGDDLIIAGGGNDRIILTDALSGSDTIAFNTISDGHDTIVGFRAAGEVFHDQDDILVLTGSADILNITFQDNGQQSGLAENTVDVTLSFAAGGRVTFEDFLSRDVDLESLFGPDAQFSQIPAPGAPLIVNGPNLIEDVKTLFGDSLQYEQF